MAYEGERNKMFFGSHLSFCSSPTAVGYAEGSCLSWVELLTSSSYSCLAADLDTVCPSAAGQVVLKTLNHQDCLLEELGTSSDGSFPVLGLACCHSGLSAWASDEMHITPQHMSTQVLSSASVMDSLGFVLYRCL